MNFLNIFLQNNIEQKFIFNTDSFQLMKKN